MSKPMENK